MANYSGASSQHQTVASGNGNGDTVTLDADYNFVEVLNRATSGNVWFTVDGKTTPTVAAAGTKVVPAGQAVTIAVPTSGNSVVMVVGDAVCAYSVTGI